MAGWRVKGGAQVVRRKAHREGEVSPGFEGSSSPYAVQYTFGSSQIAKIVKDISLAQLYARYEHILWEDGRHKYNVRAFVHEIDEIVLSAKFSIFSQEMLDGVIGTLRGRGNSNATINRKMAALGKLLRKACKMGDIHSLAEFRRQRERAGRIRFLDPTEEYRLFDAIARRSEEYHRLSIVLVDTGARLGEA